MIWATGFITLLGLLSYSSGRPLQDGVGDGSGDELELSSGLLQEVANATIEMSDEDTLLLYKSDAVYQINVPQNAVKASETLLSTASPLGLLKSFETLGPLTLAEFSQISGVDGNAQLVFNDWDVNGDGLLDMSEILQEEMKRDTAKLN